ncbi:MAG TPA: gluconokinase [Polyangia bacterium]|jgi:gluconokinase|nr:gluconokinase [Polyangia bacterium]
MVVIVMGPSGAGKSTIGLALADALGWEFLEGDDFHPQSNVDKMHRGEPLDDRDRAPWLARLATEIRARLAASTDTVLACSALKRAYRAQLVVDARVRLVNLRASPELLAARLAARHDHFMPPSLLASQLQTLEPPTDAIDIDASQPLDAIVEELRRRLSR